MRSNISFSAALVASVVGVWAGPHPPPAPRSTPRSRTLTISAPGNRCSSFCTSGSARASSKSDACVRLAYLVRRLRHGSWLTVTIQRSPVQSSGPAPALRQRRFRVAGERDLDPARLEAHRPHMPLEGEKQQPVAVGPRLGDHVVEALQHQSGLSAGAATASASSRAARVRAHALRPGACTAGTRANREEETAAMLRRLRGTARRRQHARSPRPASAGRRRGRGGPAPSRRRPADAAHPDLLDALEQHLPGAGKHRAATASRRTRRRARAPSSESAASSAASGASFSRVTQWREVGEVGEHDRRVGAGIMLRVHCGERRGGIALHHMLEEIDDAARGRRGRACRAPSPPRPCRRRGRSPGRGATAHRAPSLRRRARSCAQRLGSASMLSFAAMPARCCDRARPASMRRRSKRWQRDSTVTGTLRISVVAKMNFTCGGGSSSVFNRPLKACRRQHVHFVDDVDLVARRDRR